jgi:hypothetical protein
VVSRNSRSALQSSLTTVEAETVSSGQFLVNLPTIGKENATIYLSELKINGNQ